jgi:4-amino-4-deoxychorismate lyase
MYRFIESLKLLNGQLHNLSYHQERMDRTMQAFFNRHSKIKLANVITIPHEVNTGIYKVRVIYSHTIELIQIEPYEKKNIGSLKIVTADKIDYSFKYEDRQKLQELYSKKGSCDDILIVKNGQVTDSFAANLVFEAQGRLYTPAQPLLPGTKRQSLLGAGKVELLNISLKDIQGFDKVYLINAMLDLGEIEIKIASIMNLDKEG